MLNILRVFLLATLGANALLVARDYTKLQADVNTLVESAVNITTTANAINATNANQTVPPCEVQTIRFGLYENTTTYDFRDSTGLTNAQLQSLAGGFANSVFPQLQKGLNALVGKKQIIKNTGSSGNLTLAFLQFVQAETLNVTGAFVNDTRAAAASVQASASAVSTSFNSLVASAYAAFKSP